MITKDSLEILYWVISLAVLPIWLLPLIRRKRALHKNKVSTDKVSRITPRPPTSEEVEQAESTRAATIVNAREVGFPDGIFLCEKRQRFGPGWGLVERIDPEEVFPDVDRMEIDQAKAKAVRLLQNNYGDRLLSGTIKHEDARSKLKVAVPGFNDTAYDDALMHSCWSSR